MTNINFGGGARLKTDLQLTASTKTGIFLYGAMETPLDVVAVVVHGQVLARGLALGGKVDAKVDFGVPNYNPISTSLPQHEVVKSCLEI